MTKYICPNCSKDFKQKINFINHTEKKKIPCNLINNSLIPPISAKIYKNSQKSAKIPPKSAKIPPISSKIIDNLIKEQETNKNNHFCTYCEKSFTRIDSLKKHLNGRCKSKENLDELQKLKEDIKILLNNYQNLINEQKSSKTIVNTDNSKTLNQIINNNSNNQINKGVILNNSINVQVVQFGNENIDKLNLVDAMKSYLKSTGGNIAFNMLKYINLNKDYPENNNICITDLSREIVKIHNGEKFVYKKFKNVKDEILNKIVKNTRKIVNKYENDEQLKKSADTKNKLKINDVSLKIIDGISAEDIVREEIKETDKFFIKNIKNMELKDTDNNNNCENDVNSELEEEREFTFEERLKIEHLENKRAGLQKKTFENIKDGLYNAKELTIHLNYSQ